MRIATRRDTWQIGANVRNSPENSEKVKRLEITTPLLNLIKPQKRSPQLSPSQLPSQALRNKSTPRTPAATEETPSINKK
ncbi:hypothetical protein TNCV_3058511 [Trichonephila clavipes]|nr:hypothetical protein TNCV_3058511 [Trichonephila clavipes]